MAESTELRERKNLPRTHVASDEDRPPCAFTEGDYAIVRNLAFHRVLTVEQLCFLEERGYKAVVARTKVLFHHGYIKKQYRGANLPDAFELAERGALEVMRREGISEAAIGWVWNSKNRELKNPSIDHELGVANLILPLHLAAKQNPSELRFLNHMDLLDLAEDKVQRRRGNPFKVIGAVKHDGERRPVDKIPDGVCALQINRERLMNFIIEWDTGNPNVAPRSGASLLNPKRNYVVEKIATYAYAFTRDNPYHKAAFNWENVRVLMGTVATGKDGRRRVEEMVRAAQEFVPDSNARRLFSFVDATTLREYRHDILSMPWVNGNGIEKRLFD